MFYPPDLTLPCFLLFLSRSSHTHTSQSTKPRALSISQSIRSRHFSSKMTLPSSLIHVASSIGCFYLLLSVYRSPLSSPIIDQVSIIFQKLCKTSESASFHWVTYFIIWPWFCFSFRFLHGDFCFFSPSLLNDHHQVTTEHLFAQSWWQKRLPWSNSVCPDAIRDVILIWQCTAYKLPPDSWEHGQKCIRPVSPFLMCHLSHCKCNQSERVLHTNTNTGSFLHVCFASLSRG